MKKITLSGVIIAGILLVSGLSCRAPKNDQTKDMTDRKWWKEAVVYQIYPRSFMDSDGDGIGDLKGIISKLDYIQSLGVNVVWLNPIYSSPNDDNGYDVSDYRNIMKDFGTMADFDAMLKGMHERGIKLVMDLVVNHSSDEHEWFKQSRSSRNSPYRNYYHWWNADKGKPSPRYSLFDVNHDAWMYDSTTNAYYLHYFSRKQPDLNWENPKVRQEVFDIMKFWVDKGIDGFRLDAFQFAAKDTTFPVLPQGYEKEFTKYYAMQPGLHEYLKEMNKEVLSKYDVMSVAEGAGNSFKDAHELVDADRNELNMAYAFEGVDIAKPEGYSVLHFKEVFSKWDSVFAQKGWLSIFLANHDQARLVSRFGNDDPKFREVSSKMLTTFIMTMRGTPYYYNGDELGMTNAGFTDIKDYRDKATLNEYQHQKNIGANMAEFMKQTAFSSRDNGRTPFQWNSNANAGFTIGTPWIKVNNNYKTINEAIQDKDPNSPLNYFRRIVKLRKDNPVLVYGKYTLVDKSNPDVYAYTRELDSRKFLILLNFRSEARTANSGLDLSKAKVLIDNYTEPTTDGKLKPFEAVVYQLE
ncbi:alpha-glucosidase [Mucilaginibacter sp. BT774]|uniref:glycoside hydrolase family 13 protein n=1 Tax=Mucilaginibacter sp. BT774 TaxID=3062276 RepID=UPI0026759CA9|nr:alpha-glucosidase [Mucilaginibacter sp. BT774]MDO3626476.1 alpha-glucosidase [Mucilaginibacter sp. BT774]